MQGKDTDMNEGRDLCYGPIGERCFHVSGNPEFYIVLHTEKGLVYFSPLWYLFGWVGRRRQLKGTVYSTEYKALWKQSLCKHR